MKLRPKRLPAAVVSAVAATSLTTACSGGTSSQEAVTMACSTSHSSTVHDTSNLETLEQFVERGVKNGKGGVFIPSPTDKTRIQSLVKESNRYRVSDKNQVVVAKDSEGKVLSTSPLHKVDKHLITVIEIPYDVLERVNFVHTVKPNNSQIGAITFYPVKETNIGFEHPLEGLEGILAPGSSLPNEVNHYLLSNLSSGGILIPDISKDFINFSEVRTVTDVCSS